MERTNIFFSVPPPPPTFLFRWAAVNILLICHVLFVSVILSRSMHIGGTSAANLENCEKGEAWD